MGFKRFLVLVQPPLKKSIHPPPPKQKTGEKIQHQSPWFYKNNNDKKRSDSPRWCASTVLILLLLEVDWNEEPRIFFRIFWLPWWLGWIGWVGFGWICCLGNMKKITQWWVSWWFIYHGDESVKRITQKNKSKLGWFCWVQIIPLWTTCWELQMLSNLLTEKTFGVLILSWFQWYETLNSIQFEPRKKILGYFP